MTMFGGHDELLTSGGERIRLEARRTELVLVGEGPGGLRRTALPTPKGGVGGHALVMSPDERHFVLWLYSGQSEIGYELFRTASFEHVASFPYVIGYSMAPSFSRDGETLAMAWSHGQVLFVEDEHLHDGETLTHDALADWATVHVRALATGATSECVVSVRLDAGAPVETECDAPLELTLHAQEVRFLSDWGEKVRLPLPLPARVVIEGPARG